LTVVEPDPGPGNALRVVATAANEAEAELFQQRLAQADIQATSERVIGGPEWGASGARYIYVAATDLKRAREVLEPPDQPEPIQTT
jgi:hypothetical protein